MESRHLTASLALLADRLGRGLDCLDGGAAGEVARDLDTVGQLLAACALRGDHAWASRDELRVAAVTAGRMARGLDVAAGGERVLLEVLRRAAAGARVASVGRSASVAAA